MYYTYVLFGRTTGKIYKGVTSDLKQRVGQHKNGLVKSTKHETDWILIYYQAFINKTDARREELFLKSGKGRDRLKLVLADTLKIVGGVA